MGRKGASRISVVSANPDALAGVDSDRVAAFQAASGKAMMKLRQATQANKVSWTVVAAAGQDWAQKCSLMLPRRSTRQAMGSNFQNDAYLRRRSCCCLEKHDETLQVKAEELNKEQFSALHYTAPGTDLIIGLPKITCGKVLAATTPAMKIHGEHADRRSLYCPR